MISRLARRRIFLASITVGAAGAACAPPIQSGGVEVRAGAAERLGMVCRWRHGTTAGEGLCADAEEPVAPSRVKRIAGPADALAGPLAAGRVGDLVIENGEIAVVIDQLGRGSGFAESGGNIIDAGDARARRDELGQIFTYFGVFPRQAVHDALDSGVDSKGTAWIEVRGHELYEEHLRVTTRYELAPGQRALSIQTTLVNETGAPVTGLELGDVVQWGSAEKFAIGKEPGFVGDYAGPWIGAAGRSAAYAILDADPRATSGLTAKNGTAWSNISFVRGVALAPGAGASYARVLVVAPRGDTLAAATEVFYLQGGAPGGLEIALTDAAGARIAPPVGGRFTLARAGEGRTAPSSPSSPPDLWLGVSENAAKSGTNVAAEAPPGSYLVTFSGAGRHEIAAVPVTIESGHAAAITLAVSDAGALHLRVMERRAGASAASPGKIQIFAEGSDRRVVPPVLVGSDGLADIPAAPGRYRVVASRGPEFTLAEQLIAVEGGKTTAAVLTLDRVVDTRGFIGCDLHQHSAPSADSGVSTRERILSNAAEGVECAVASEHNLIVDLGAIVRETKLDPFFRSIVGDELTSDASREPFGHLNAFPLQVDPTDARGGAFPVRDRTAKEAMDAIRAVPGEHVIQVNHPRTGRTGYFDQYRFDPALGVGAAPGYDARFDAVEVWSGRYVKARSSVLDDLFALLRTSHPVTPTANTDTHGIFGQEAGYPRTYVKVADDDPARLDPADLAAGLRTRRDVVLTNGPFVTIRVGDVEQGGLVTLPKQGATLSIHVERAPWIDVTELLLRVGGVVQIVPLAGKPGPSTAIIDDVEVRLVRPGRRADPKAHGLRALVAEDTFVVVEVRGQKPLEPVLTGDASEILPFAMTAPIWIDEDGDGQCLGRGR
jgi:hypothetical protein